MKFKVKPLHVQSPQLTLFAELVISFVASPRLSFEVEPLCTYTQSHQKMSSTEEQLVSFFAYSFIVYPIVYYLMSPHRKYSRSQGVVYAIAVLGIVAYLHMVS